MTFEFVEVDMPKIIMCPAISNHTCGECARDKSICNYPSDDVVACDEFVEFEEDQQYKSKVNQRRVQKLLALQLM